jgi:hypothetical protein
MLNNQWFILLVAPWDVGCCSQRFAPASAGWRAAGGHAYCLYQLGTFLEFEEILVGNL